MLSGAIITTTTTRSTVSTATINSWEDVSKVLPHVSRILLYGPPGTGKTTIGFADDREVFYVPLHEETAVAELLGHFVPVGNRFVWFDGPVLMAWERGARLILDEIDQSGGAVLSVLRAVLNDPSVAQLILPDPSLAGLDDETMTEFIAAGEGQRIVRPTEGFQVIATMNGEPEDLDEPLLDRFEATFHIPNPHPDAIAALPKDLRKAAATTSKHAEAARRIGLRRWKAFASLREHVGEDMAARAVFGHRNGDVMDALRLARPADKPKTDEPKTDEPPTPSVEPVVIGSDITADTPMIYVRKTGKRGRPALVTCPKHGWKMTHRTGAVAADNGAVVCRKCGATAAEAGDYRRRVLVGGEWKTVD